MLVFEAMAIIISMVLFSGTILAILNMVLSHRREMAEIRSSDHEPDVSDTEKIELKETVAMLQDRLSVLETIATDPARRTAEEIEKLR